MQLPNYSRFQLSPSCIPIYCEHNRRFNYLAYMYTIHNPTQAILGTPSVVHISNINAQSAQRSGQCAHCLVFTCVLSKYQRSFNISRLTQWTYAYGYCIRLHLMCPHGAPTLPSTYLSSGTLCSSAAVCLCLATFSV